MCLLALSGCAAAPLSEYIGTANHPYDRKIQENYQKVTGAVVYVLRNKGWSVAEESLPSVYERNERYEHNGYQNLLIMTAIKRHYWGLYGTLAHLNILVHSLGDASEVEIRYESRVTFIRQFIFTRSDRMVEGMLDAIEKEATK
ncbi:MAG: hypothetical protein KGK03_05295 [Candidatus Omnitrophica bacterium]|nr:hypothetical protein [Candidatus Omnitrophota bacterium]MDE2222471.1 hypothetical protein [Candidatus Omnitrophota bacterium]